MTIEVGIRLVIMEVEEGGESLPKRCSRREAAEAALLAVLDGEELGEGF